MFFNKKVMNSDTLKHAWRAANNQQTDSDQASLPTICKKLDHWIANDYPDAGRHLSLRASSTLVDGAAKLYKQELKNLQEDVYDLEMDMIKRKRTNSMSESDVECGPEKSRASSSEQLSEISDDDDNVDDDDDDDEDDDVEDDDDEDGDDAGEKSMRNSQVNNASSESRNPSEPPEKSVVIFGDEKLLAELPEGASYAQILFYDTPCKIPGSMLYCVLQPNTSQMLKTYAKITNVKNK